MVSNPNYGEIFYSDDKKDKGPNNLLRESLKTEKARNDDLIKYMHQLEEENAQLRAQLSQLTRNNRQEEANSSQRPNFQPQIPNP